MTGRLLLTWLSLLGLLGLTIGASFVLKGGPSLGTSLAIAFVKAALVFWYFMRLRAEPGLIRLAAMAGGAWLLLLVVLSFADYLTRPGS